MSKPYDAAAKDLVESDPAGWAALLGVSRPPGTIVLAESELSTVTAAADKVIRVNDPSPWLIDVEFQSWRDPSLPRQLLKYNALLHERHKLPVASVVVVLAAGADSPAYTGRYRVEPPLGPAWEFGYTVVRVWELPAEPLLTGSLALLPLAPIARVAPADVPDVLARVGDRLARETDPGTGDRLLTAIGILLPLRFGAVTTEELIRQFPHIRETGIFAGFTEAGRQEGRQEGRAEEARAVILRMGRKKFGPPTPAQEAGVNGLTDLARLEALSEKLLDVNTWDELLRD